MKTVLTKERLSDDEMKITFYAKDFPNADLLVTHVNRETGEETIRDVKSIEQRGVNVPIGFTNKEDKLDDEGNIIGQFVFKRRYKKGRDIEDGHVTVVVGERIKPKSVEHTFYVKSPFESWHVDPFKQMYGPDYLEKVA